MSVRHERIMRLYASRHDHLPEPVRRSDAAAGFVHRVAAREVCPDCFGERPARVGCESCRGRGYLERVRDRDPYAVTRVQPYGLSGLVVERARDVDRQIARLESQLAPAPVSELDAVAEANRHPYAWELARRRMYRDFDYRALDVALERLAGCLPGVDPVSPRGLRFLDALMPDPIRAPAAPRMPALNAAARGRWVGRRALEERDREIRRHASEGQGPQWLAWHYGLSVARVYAIVKRHSPSTGCQEGRQRDRRGA